MDFLHCKQLALGLNSSVVDTGDKALVSQGCPEEEQSDRTVAPLLAFVQSLQGSRKAPTSRLAWCLGSHCPAVLSPSITDQKVG